MHTIVKTPQLGTNDNFATLVEWNTSDKDIVSSGDIICSLETSKATFDIEAKADGHLIQLVELGDQLSVSQSIALIGQDLNQLINEKNKIIERREKEKNPDENINATKKAILLSKKLDVDLSKIKSKGIIREKDVNLFVSKNEIVANHENSDVVKSIDLIGNRKVGKDLMLFSANNIPQSYIERKIVVDNWIKKINDIYEKEEKYITILSLVIFALSRALIKKPIFNSYRNDDEILTYKEVNIGVVISLDDTISVPVIKGANKLEPSEIVKQLMEIRKSLITKKPNMDDFTGGTFTISAMDHTDVVRFTPIIHPKQSAVLAIPKIQQKVMIDDNSSIKKFEYINMGISFDHSFLDANQANNFFTIIIDELDKFCK